MKARFYFVLWSFAYLLLGQVDNSFVYEHMFLLALLFVIAILWVLNQLIPNTLAFERVSQTAPIMEEIYTGNITSFKKRLSKDPRV